MSRYYFLLWTALVITWLLPFIAHALRYSNKFPPGVPTLNIYYHTINSTYFKTLEQFSDKFVRDNSANYDKYGQKWVRDPLHAWSRKYEYSYVFAAIESILQPSSLVVDAGAGYTFFPYVLAFRHPRCKLAAVDSDPNLSSLHSITSAPAKDNLSYQTDTLEMMKISDGTVDVLYCVSVLEHTDDPQKVIAEFARVLKPGGFLILTFDIGLGSINTSRAKIILDRLRSLLVEETMYHASDDMFVDSPLFSNRMLTPIPFPEHDLTVSCHVFRKPIVRALS